MDKFTQKLDLDLATNQRVLQLIGQIDSFKGKWSITEVHEGRYLKELREIATIESTGSSTRIEGSTLTDQEVKHLLDNIRITKLETRDAQEVVGYYEVLSLICDHYTDLQLSENSVKQLHQILLKYSSKDERHRGGYKHLPNKVIATYPTGEQRTIFETTEPAMVEFEMRELIAWTNTQFSEQNLHPLLVIAVCIYEFLSIHPFQDGNGRLSRLLTTLCLLQNDYMFIRYISFERQIEENKNKYYEVLMSAQSNRGTGTDRIDQWVLFFLESLKMLIVKLEQKYDEFKSKGGYVNERQRILRDFIAEHKYPVKFSDIAKHFSGIPPGTLKKDLQYLRNEQILLMLGKGKGSVYVLNKKE